MNSRDVIAKLRADGWYEVAQAGSHKQFKHPMKSGRVTVVYPSREIPIGTLRSIEKQAGLKLRVVMRSYIALIHKDAEHDFGVSFPDLPGCVTAGSDLDEARAFAEEALALHVAGLAEDGVAVPEPSTLDSVMRDAINRDAVAVLVQAKGATPKVVRVNITVPEDVLGAIDAYAEQHGMNRSGFLVRAAKHEMEDKREHEGARDS